MTDSFRTTPPNQQWSPTEGSYGNQLSGSNSDLNDDEGSGELGKALAVGVLGGLLSIAGYMVYRRLPDEQKDKLNAQVRSVVTQRVNEMRKNFNV